MLTRARIARPLCDAASIADRIAGGELVMEQYCVARVTVRQAISVLADDGLVERIQGKGTFVAASIQHRKIVHPSSSRQSFIQMLDGNVPVALRAIRSARRCRYVTATGARPHRIATCAGYTTAVASRIA
jgi:hypothetical protein